MAVELTDFEVRPYRISNQSESTDLDSFIEAKEEEILRSLLGTALYNQLIAAEASPPVAQKWTDLRDGATYTYGGVEYEYKGLTDLLVPCIFAFWVKENSDQFTDSSTVRGVLTHANAVSPARRISEAYSKFCDKVGSECEYCDTLYGFLLANLADYEDWVFKEPEPMNQFDI